MLASAPNGLETDPGFVVFVKDTKGGIYLCNATSDAMIWAFEPIGDPLSFEQQTSWGHYAWMAGSPRPSNVMGSVQRRRAANPALSAYLRSVRSGA